MDVYSPMEQNDLRSGGKPAGGDKALVSAIAAFEK